MNEKAFCYVCRANDELEYIIAIEDTVLKLAKTIGVMPGTIYKRLKRPMNQQNKKFSIEKIKL